MRVMRRTQGHPALSLNARYAAASVGAHLKMQTHGSAVGVLLPVSLALWRICKDDPTGSTGHGRVGRCVRENEAKNGLVSPRGLIGRDRSARIVSDDSPQYPSDPVRLYERPRRRVIDSRGGSGPLHVGGSAS